MVSRKVFSSKVFEIGSDILHFIIGILLILLGSVFVFHVVTNLNKLLIGQDLAVTVGTILNKIFFVLMILEMAHTVMISYQEHIIKPEPFLLIGLIASVRRILALTLNLVETHPGIEEFKMAMIETAILGALILILVVAIVLLRRCDQRKKEEKSIVEIESSGP
ncbi:hypothetical protein KFV02_01440 [Desulfohalobiaceae bacterium Ax17]|jgi:uncharacterized membrane protein (DUF373 family)|uniref:phosphate-starvation-inducible PsiE family protein n=1 Tax=Desulfovulcanus ferrireducens TaxID=2831190 RepID=UPI00207B9D54|nr:phosphate-starvation-inducible PsiE family protein [Desulfovulcanus ferrireducens]MBT8762595.1 hypothetical protein [Desulfovulcanus ferrireducens]